MISFTATPFALPVSSIADETRLGPTTPLRVIGVHLRHKSEALITFLSTVASFVLLMSGLVEKTHLRSVTLFQSGENRPPFLCLQR